MLGWVAFALVVQKASRIEGEAAQFDPFTILGVSSVSILYLSILLARS